MILSRLLTFKKTYIDEKVDTSGLPLDRARAG